VLMILILIAEILMAKAKRCCNITTTLLF
jgi:hypothetical protein